MNHLRSIACVAAEELLLELRPEDLAARSAEDGELREHLACCRSCRELAAGIELLAGPEQAPPLPNQIFEAAFRAAANEAAALAVRRRKAVAVAAVKAAGVFAAWLAVVAVGASSLLDWARAQLSAPAFLAVGGITGLALLVSLSVLAFTLILVAGAAAQPPRDPAALEV